MLARNRALASRKTSVFAVLALTPVVLALSKVPEVIIPAAAVTFCNTPAEVMTWLPPTLRLPPTTMSSPILVVAD